MKKILGTKIGMTQVFTKEGKKIAVTVIHIEPNQVLAVKTSEKDGYDAVQVGYKEIDKNKINKPKAGIFKKANANPTRFIRELRGVTGYNVGDKIDVSVFEQGEVIDVQAKSKGHGFTGSIKRHNFHIGPMGHGAGYPHRYVGSISGGRGGSQAQRVFKGTKLPGHYGHETVTTTNLVIVDVNKELNLMLIQGSVPGPKNGLVRIQTTKHSKTKKIDIELVNYHDINNKVNDQIADDQNQEQVQN